MAKTVVGLFDDFSEAQRAVRDLADAGFSRDNISLIANDARGEYADVARGHDASPTAEAAGAGAVGGTVVGGLVGLLVGIGALTIPGIGPVLAAGPIASAIGSTALGAGIGAAAGGLLGALVGLGIPEEDAGYYAEGVRRGGTLVMVSASDTMAQQAVDILGNHGAVDIERRGEYYRQSGYAGFNANTQPLTGEELTSYRTTNQNIYGTARTNLTTDRGVTASTGVTANTGMTANRADTGEVAIPIVEEELHVGKREVNRGGVRIYTSVEEIPVQEQVTLRQEHVEVERRPVDRTATAADFAPLETGKIEVTEHGEEAVIAKEARVVEEVVVRKDVEQETRTVQDTVRRTDVDVEEITGDTTATQTTDTTIDSTGRGRTTR